MPSAFNGKERLLRYPALLSQCIFESSAYAKCILSVEDVKRHSCEKEFQILKRCVQKRSQEAAPPWQLINKLFSTDTPPRPPTPPGSTAYRMFGNFYNSEDAILRSLESQGVRRVYPQTYNRKRELKKINFSILANYLDLLDIITRDPSSPKRTEKLDHLAILFINMHHLVNEYRQHQARDLLREILKYQRKNFLVDSLFICLIAVIFSKEDTI
ncbi:unnamed protein product [Trichobilharzia regenti]|nr:unnamed protein product [Trichobilharzia regenti]